jgi:hypothetical protein
MVMGSSEIALRMSGIRAGVRVALVLALASATYLAATPEGPHRLVLSVVVVLCALDALLVASLPVERIAREERQHDLLLTSWNLVHIAAAVGICLLDGGALSPFRAIFFVAVAFAAVSLKPRHVVVVAAAAVAGLGIVAAAGNTWAPGLLFTIPSLVVIAAMCTSIANARARSLAELQLAQDGMLQRVARVIEYRDNETGQHTERMSAYCGVIARELGWDVHEAESLKRAATMHDVGKVAVPDAVLLKPGPLTPCERAVMERHTIVGFEMLAGSPSDLIQAAATIARSHHERVDGQGYPDGLSGDAIPLPGRIVAVADVFDALTSDRVYRAAMPVDKALGILAEGRGTQFDGAVLDAFERGLDDILAIRAETVGDGKRSEPVAA